MMPVRTLVALCLALALALGAVASGVARGQAPAVATVTICGTDGPALLPVDADGRPAGRTHHCPDCLAPGAVVPVAAPAAPIRPMRWRALARSRARACRTGRIPSGARARGPPLRS